MALRVIRSVFISQSAKIHCLRLNDVYVAVIPPQQLKKKKIINNTKRRNKLTMVIDGTRLVVEWFRANVLPHSS